MGAAVGFAATGLSLIAQGISESQGAAYKGVQAQRASEIGKVQADQQFAAHTDRINTTIANIRAIRAATGANPFSPTGAAVEGAQATAGERTRRIQVGGTRMQADQYAADAGFYRNAASSALLGTTAKGIAYFSTPPANVAGAFA